MTIQKGLTILVGAIVSFIVAIIFYAFVVNPIFNELERINPETKNITEPTKEAIKPSPLKIIFAFFLFIFSIIFFIIYLLRKSDGSSSV